MYANSPTRPALLEPLEPRALLAADLAVLSASTTDLTSPGAPGTGTITLKNTGTLPLTGRVSITFVATAAGQSNQTLGHATLTLSQLQPDATQSLDTISLTAPRTATPQLFNIVARITPHTKPADTAAGNNAKSAGTVTLTPPSPGPTANPFGIPNAGTKLHFKKTKSLSSNGTGGVVHESGTFTDNKGHTGTYTLTLPPAPSAADSLLDLTFNPKKSFPAASLHYTLTFTPTTKRLNSGLNRKSITFATSPTNTSATATPTTTGPSIYLKY